MVDRTGGASQTLDRSARACVLRGKSRITRRPSPASSFARGLVLAVPLALLLWLALALIVVGGGMIVAAFLDLPPMPWATIR